MKFFVLFLTLFFCVSGKTFEGIVTAEISSAEEFVLERTHTNDLAFACGCVSFGGNSFTERACNALPITQCGRVGNIVCLPVCR